MNRTLAIIMLDFFVMSSIAFFVLQFIQPETPKAMVSSNSSIFRIEISKAAYITAFDAAHPTAKIESIPLSDLVELGVVSHPKDQPTLDIPLFYSVDDDGITVVASSKVTKPIDLVVYPKKIKSLKFAISKPSITLAGGDSSGASPPAYLDFSAVPYAVLHVGGQ